MVVFIAEMKYTEPSLLTIVCAAEFQNFAEGDDLIMRCLILGS